MEERQRRMAKKDLAKLFQFRSTLLQASTLIGRMMHMGGCTSGTTDLAGEMLFLSSVIMRLGDAANGLSEVEARIRERVDLSDE
jgi:hypothetical protein